MVHPHRSMYGLFDKNFFYPLYWHVVMCYLNHYFKISTFQESILLSSYNSRKPLKHKISSIIQLNTIKIVYRSLIEEENKQYSYNSCNTNSSYLKCSEEISWNFLGMYEQNRIPKSTSHYILCIIKFQFMKSIPGNVKSG